MKKILVLALVFSVALLGGCAWFGGNEPTETGPIDLVDDFGREIQLEGPAQRIVSLSPSSTELVFAVGLGDRLVGATEICNYPPEAQEVPKVGGFGEPNLELIVSSEPDLVLASSLHKETVDALEEMGIAVLALDPRDIEGIYANIQLLAVAGGVEGAGDDLIQDMKNRLDDVAQTLAGLSDDERPVVYYEVWYPGPMTVGEDTFIHEMITRAGGKNVAWGTTGYPTLQEEELLERNPDVIVHAHGGTDSSEFAARDGWNVITAVAQDSVYYVNADILNRTGPRVVDAIEEMAAIFHPDKF